MAKGKKSGSILRKPELGSGAVLQFAQAKSKTGSLKVTDSGKRSFLAPEGDKRLTINLRNDVHKRLRIVAVERDTTIGEIIEDLVAKHL